MADEPIPEPAPEPEPETEPDLGDAGKRALDEERAARKDADRKLKAAEAALEKIKAASMTEQERAVAEAKAQARAEVLEEANERLLRSEIRAAAAGKLTDPDDAPALLGDLGRFLADDGEINTKAIKSAIGELVKSKPYLAVAGSRPGPLPGGGARPSSGTSINDEIRQMAGRA